MLQKITTIDYPKNRWIPKIWCHKVFMHAKLLLTCMVILYKHIIQQQKALSITNFIDFWHHWEVLCLIFSATAPVQSQKYQNVNKGFESEEINSIENWKTIISNLSVPSVAVELKIAKSGGKVIKFCVNFCVSKASSSIWIFFPTSHLKYL